MISTGLKGILITAGIASLLNGNGYNVTQDTSHLYPTCGVVTEVTETEMTFTDFSGNMWTIKGDTEDWIEGDRIAAIMDDNGTEIVYDDIIVSTRYCGWVY